MLYARRISDCSVYVYSRGKASLIIKSLNTEDLRIYYFYLFISGKEEKRLHIFFLLFLAERYMDSSMMPLPSKSITLLYQLSASPT